MKPRLLDTYSKAAGAGMGYHRAGFEVVCVDIEPQPHNPFEFIQADALEVLADRGFLAGFDAIHASPPCQSETDLRHRTGVDYEDFLTPTLALLKDVTVPWVVENVASTKKLPGALILCGTEFGLKATCRAGETRWLSRHRRFASNVFLVGAGGCHCTTGKLIGGVYGNGGGGKQNRGYKFHAPEARAAMGIDWMTRDEMAQAIPPAYTEFIGQQLVAELERRAAAMSALDLRSACGHVAAAGERCRCGHGAELHDLARDEVTRKGCSVSVGPKALRCPCAHFQPETEVSA